jgi:cell division transport system ATP-binding protein
MKRRRPLTDNLVKPLVSLYRVSRFYRNDRSALFDISFDVYGGEFLYITGSSGAGKSTLIKLMGALEFPDTGRLRFNGHDIQNVKRSAIALLRRNMGIVFQDFRLVPEMSVSANIALPLEVAGLSPKLVRKKVTASLAKVGLSGRELEKARDLSGGEQQRAAIARAVAPGPELILADEPTGNLDAYNANCILDLLEKMHREEGTTVVLATHDRMMMAARPHRTVTLEKGRMTGMSSSGEPPAYRIPIAAGLKTAG